MKLKLRYNIVIAVLLLWPLFSFSAGVNTAETWLKEGNQFYSKANYTLALKSYRKIIDAGVNSATVYYNAGNASYKNGDLAWAVYYYEKAKKMNPADEDVNINLQFARLKTIDKLDSAPQFFITRWWHAFILSLPLQTLAVLSIAFMLLAAGALIWYLFAGSVPHKKIAFYSGLSLLCIALVFMLMGNQQSHYFNTNKEAVIFSTSVSAKSEPNAGAKNLFVLHDGSKVAITGRNASWLKVKLPNGSEGWVLGSDAKEI